ncbi:hypothetical protein [Lactococcus cremoris]|uniref:Uncharacterized protein n=1 Tax=Lactococcus lactis subsp. cremoris TaxID=1359 RepID=A0A166KG08_LACLC|nr:hypothetical protein [Lactococcus cremoris]KGH34051.1 hypothetical protein JL36_04690 [Lactococcus cremoris]KZK08337.1 hypothetical protein AB996_0234 [Lactococcus cremoris]QSE64014.1 hypothetical protein JWR96_02480 [Lactococcus cremoris]WMX69633.1 hypothetical protein RF668_06930 [Lactococcus cremoris]
MDIVDQLIKKAQKELQKIQIQTLGKTGTVSSYKQREKRQKSAKLESETAKNSISKNSAELKEAIKGKFSDKLSETFEEQKQMLDNI